MKNRKNIKFGRVSGFIWGGSGRVLGVSWALLGASGLLFGRSEAIFLKAFIQDRLQEAFWIDFGSILGGFGEGLGGFWGRIWKDLQAFGHDLEGLKRIWRELRQSL